MTPKKDNAKVDFIYLFYLLFIKQAYPLLL